MNVVVAMVFARMPPLKLNRAVVAPPTEPTLWVLMVPPGSKLAMPVAPATLPSVNAAN